MFGRPADLLPREVNFNAAHGKARRVIECCFGLLKQRFRVLLFRMELKTPEFTVIVIKACLCLHNLLLQYEPLTAQELDERLHDAIDGDNDPIPPDAPQQYQRRHRLVNHFPNTLPLQDE